MGDASDNIPGVPGIGEKTAQKLIAEYDSVENLLANRDQIKGKRGENLEEFHDQALLSKQLVTIALDAPVDELTWDDLAVAEPDRDALKDLFAELEFKTLAARLLGDDAGVAVEESRKTLKDVPHQYHTVSSAAELTKLIKKLGSADAFCFDVETTGLDVKTCRLLGIAFALKAGEAWYVPLSDRDYDEWLELLRPVFENDAITKIGHNLKFDIGVLSWHDIAVRGPVQDSMLAAYVAMPDSRRKMDYLAGTLLNYDPIPYDEVQNRPGELAAGWSES